MRIFHGFRFHLSTAFICMIVAALLVLLNVIHWPIYIDFHSGPVGQLSTVRVQFGFKCGWPFEFYETMSDSFFNGTRAEPDLTFKKASLASDFLIFLALVTSTAIVLERRIRFRNPASE